MKLHNIGITGFTLHDRETGKEMNAEWLAEEEQYKRLMIDDIEGFAFGAEGQLYLLDECGAWEDVDADKYEVHWEITGHCLVLTFDENAENADLLLPNMDQETTGRILAFLLRCFAKSMATGGMNIIDVHHVLHGATDYALTETCQELLDEKRKDSL